MVPPDSPKTRSEDIDFGKWSLLDLAKWRYTNVKSGTFRGLRKARIPNDCFEIVQRRAERDSIWPGPTRGVAFDCLECGACCKGNNVVLDAFDEEVIREGGRGDLLRAPYTRRNKDGKLVLLLLKNGRCQQLGKDNKCGIYPLRPDACSSFPMGSECCVSAREEEYKWYDGLPPEKR